MTRKLCASQNKVSGDDILPLIEGIPMAIGIDMSEDPRLPNPELLEFYNDLKNRIFYFDVDVDPGVVIQLQKYIIAWNKEDEEKGFAVEDRKPIKVMINTPGGDVAAMNNMIDMILLSKTPVYTYNLSMAFSAGFDILLAGHKRFCLPRSRVLIHGGSAAFSGTNTQINDMSENYKKIQKQFEDWLYERTKISKTLYAKKKKNEWYLDAKEQLELGVVDEIITDISQLF